MNLVRKTFMPDFMFSLIEKRIFVYCNFKRVECMENKIYPIGIQNFEKIRKDGYFYIDKTALIYQLVKTGSYYFLSRPRRFGKSLLLSTLEAYFQGKKELFDGLAMEKLEKDWIKYPILHLDLNVEKYTAPEALDQVLESALRRWEALYGAQDYERTFASRFQGIIQRACEKTGQRVVILVYLYHAKKYNAAIGDVVATSDHEAGQVDIVFIMADGSKPGAAMISGLQAYLSGKTIRPMTDKLTVKAPEEVTYSINLTYYINRSDSARAVAIQAAVAQAVEEYKTWQRTIGRDVNPSQLAAMVMEAGAKRVTVTAPTFAAVAATKVAALTGLATVTYGGLEDD